MKKASTKKCKECGQQFTPRFTSFQKTCNEPVCIAAHGKKVVEKERKDKSKAVIDALKEKHKDAKFYKEILKRVFHTFIKLRDKDDGCISCGTKDNVQFAAGHFWTVGSCPALRFNEDNVHKQCNMNCNKNRSGNINEYRPALIKKIGQERFDALESQKGVPKHYTVDELKEMIVLYRSKIKELTK